MTATSTDLFRSQQPDGDTDAVRQSDSAQR